MKKLMGISPFFIGSLFLFGISFLITGNVNPYYYSILIYTGINITLAVSLQLVNGITGQFSMGHAGFMAVGAYVSSFLSTVLGPSIQAEILNLGLPEFFFQPLFFAFILYCGGLAAAILGYIVGLPSLRLKGDYLAIVTLGFGEITRVLILNINAVGAARGLPGIPQWSNFGWVYSVALICILTVRRLVHSCHGRALLAIREDEIAAEAMGVKTTRYKVNAFTIGAFFAGISGGLFAHFLTYINPAVFDFNRSFEIIIMVVLGGMGSTSGAVLAAIFLTILREALRPLQEITRVDLRMVIYSLMLIVLMLTRPNGFLGSKEWFPLAFLFKKKKAVSNG